MLEHDQNIPPKLNRRTFLAGLAAAGAGLSMARMPRFAEESATSLESVVPSGPSAMGFAPGPEDPEESIIPAVTVPLIGREAWGASPPRKAYRSMRSVSRLTVHHSAQILSDNRDAPAHFRSHQRMHYKQGRPDIAYHILVDRMGNLYQGRPLVAQAESSGGRYDPTGHILVMCEGNFQVQKMPTQQLSGLADVLAWGCQRFGVSPRSIHGHRQFAQTACPGTHLNNLLRDGTLRGMVEDRIAAGGVNLVWMPKDEAARHVRKIERGLA